MERVLYTRAAHSHLSMRAEAPYFGICGVLSVILILNSSLFTLHFSLPKFVKLIHGLVDALQHEALDDVYREVEGRLQDLHVVG